MAFQRDQSQNFALTCFVKFVVLLTDPPGQRSGGCERSGAAQLAVRPGPEREGSGPGEACDPAEDRIYSGRRDSRGGKKDPKSRLEVGLSRSAIVFKATGKKKKESFGIEASQ